MDREGRAMLGRALADGRADRVGRALAEGRGMERVGRALDDGRAGVRVAEGSVETETVTEAVGSLAHARFTQIQSWSQSFSVVHRSPRRDIHVSTGKRSFKGGMSYQDSGLPKRRPAR